jgi:hypothetical protein
VEHTRYNSSRKRRQLKQPAATRLARKDPQRVLNGTAVTHGSVSAVDSEGRTIWIAQAHCGDGHQVIVRADEMLSAFLEPESATRKNSIDTLCRLLPESHSR